MTTTTCTWCGEEATEGEILEHTAEIWGRIEGTRLMGHRTTRRFACRTCLDTDQAQRDWEAERIDRARIAHNEGADFATVADILNESPPSPLALRAEIQRLAGLEADGILRVVR